MGQRFPLQRQHHYPHFQPEHRQLWELFLDSPHPDLIDVEYDVPVGPTTFPVTDVDPETRRLAEALTRRRIDALVRGPQSIYVIEIKPRAGLEAFGQALGYSWLYAREFHPPELVIPVVLTDVAVPGIPELLRAHGVALWLVDRSPSSPPETDRA